MQSFIGFQQARFMLRMMRAPHYAGVACPACGAPPPAGPFWQCTCGQPFDHFAHGGVCPRCGRFAPQTPCLECGAAHPIHAWYGHVLEPAVAQRPVFYQPYTPPPPAAGSVPGFDRSA
jgi:hypothetical protein